MADRDHPREAAAKGDPWHAFGYLVSGVGLYGVLGWLADRWLGTSFLVVAGIMFGAVLGIYLTWSRFREEPVAPGQASGKTVTKQEKQ